MKQPMEDYLKEATEEEPQDPIHPVIEKQIEEARTQYGIVFKSGYGYVTSIKADVMRSLGLEERDEIVMTIRKTGAKVPTRLDRLKKRIEKRHKDDVPEQDKS